MSESKWVDRNGNNLTYDQVRQYIHRAVGAMLTLEDIKVGGIYQNGSIWFQRIS